MKDIVVRMCALFLARNVVQGFDIFYQFMLKTWFGKLEGPCEASVRLVEVVLSSVHA